ncbi:MAG TPA: hypothetical protein VNN12_04350, partial [Dehalococcoidia bacterium]|nr:hypothetical protein [Dehalococcoidia bacterium]
MRILSLGFPMPGPRVDNYNFLSAPTFSDYEAIVVEPGSFSRVVEEVVAGEGDHRTFFDEPVVNGPTGPGAVGLADLLRDRRRQTARLLAGGGLVIVFAYPDVVHAGVAGFTGCDRYFWLPAPAGIAWHEPHLVRAAGDRLGDIDREHPFAEAVETMAKYAGVRAEFAEEARRAGRAFVRSPGGSAIGVEFSAGGGTIVFLPALRKPPAAEDRYHVSEALQDAILRVAGRLDEAAPVWLKDYPLPGLADAEAELAEARVRLEEAAAEVREAQARKAALDRRLRILWLGSGPALRDALSDALGVIGFTVAGGATEPLTATIENQRVAVEIEASEGEVGLEPHYRLRARLEEAIAEGKTPPRGVVFVNGHRKRPPASRPQQYAQALRVAA